MRKMHPVQEESTATTKTNHCGPCFAQGSIDERESSPSGNELRRCIHFDLFSLITPAFNVCELARLSNTLRGVFDFLFLWPPFQNDCIGAFGRKCARVQDHILESVSVNHESRSLESLWSRKTAFI